MSKNIVLLSDGTGNSAAKAHRTNVWRLYRALDLSEPKPPRKGSDDEDRSPPPRQVAFYDDGVGTETFLPLKLLGGALGIGLARNVKQLYAFLCQNYKEGDRIYMFGFSRGAFTVRLLAGLVFHQGLCEPGPDSQVQEEANKAYRRYRVARYHQGLAWRGWVKLVSALGLAGPAAEKPALADPRIEFIGVWDTVDAYGMPVDELVSVIDHLVYPLRLPDQQLSPRVNRARHALALDDERQTFHPTLWDERLPDIEESLEDAESLEKGERDIQQVWFAGAHSNVGGGYPKDELASISLDWMMDEAARGERGLRFNESERQRIRAQAYAHGKLYDSRAGLGAYYRYEPRNLEKLCGDEQRGVVIETPKIHSSVLDRIVAGVVPYAPLALPERYEVVPPVDGTDARLVEGKKAARARVTALDEARDTVFWRQVLYYAILLATFLLVGSRFFLHWRRGAPATCEGVACLMDPLLTGATWVLPSFASAWIEALQQNTGWLWGFALAFVVLMALKKHLHTRTETQAGAAWQPLKAAEAQEGQPTPTEEEEGEEDGTTEGKPRLFSARWFRSNRPCLKLYDALSGAVAPSLVFGGLVLILVFGASRLLFEVRATEGWVCDPGPSPAASRLPDGGTGHFTFRTNASCYASPLLLEKGERYRFHVVVEEEWKDGPFAAGPDGLSSPVGHLALAPFMPTRRSWTRPWFALMGRIDYKGKARFSIGSKPTEIEAHRSGRLYTFVNDAVCGYCPGASATFPYRWRIGPNRGTARIIVEHLHQEAPVPAIEAQAALR